MAASLSGFAAISQTFSRSNEREQKDRITLLPLPSSRSSLFSLSSSLPTAISVEFLWELSDIHICLLLHQKFQPRPAQPTSSPLSYKGFAATYDISLPSYLPIHLPLSCPPLLIPFQPLQSTLPLLLTYVLRHQRPKTSPFVLFPRLSPSSLEERRASKRFVLFFSFRTPRLCHFRSVQFFFALPSNVSFSVLPAFPRRSGLTSPPFFHRPLRTAPPSGPFVTRLETSLSIYVYICAQVCARYFPFFFLILSFLSYFLILVFLSGWSLVFYL